MSLNADVVYFQIHCTYFSYIYQTPIRTTALLETQVEVAVIQKKLYKVIR